ncbi:unnamed protein product [Heligmosomoides polygyrus]|uniref:Bestrophin homolog n=1 Tax=Heligmosomoides polygyrus TaxID=6339 RepID=A0A3P8CVX9_HELPZ|nr:unnamed protein product [Heligmosomoides polygyrus]
MFVMGCLSSLKVIPLWERIITWCRFNRVLAEMCFFEKIPAAIKYYVRERTSRKGEINPPEWTPGNDVPGPRGHQRTTWWAGAWRERIWRSALVGRGTISNGINAKTGVLDSPVLHAERRGET